jgi:hypothetical protein
MFNVQFTWQTPFILLVHSVFHDAPKGTKGMARKWGQKDGTAERSESESPQKSAKSADEWGNRGIRTRGMGQERGALQSGRGGVKLAVMKGKVWRAGGWRWPIILIWGDSQICSCTSGYAAETRPMKTLHLYLIAATLLVLGEAACAQGFMNLDFEQATTAPTPVGGWTFPAEPAQCFPGWTVGYGDAVMYNTYSLGAPAVCLMGPEFPNAAHYPPLEGSYSVLLMDYGGGPTLSQVGLIPSWARSINFLVGPCQSDAVVSLNGVNIPLAPIAGGRFAGDVSAFDGQVAQLTFSAMGTLSGFGNWFYFDDIQFSPSSVPEPSAMGFLSACILSLWLARRPSRGGCRQLRDRAPVPCGASGAHGA